jgi:hypothetical protein
MKWMVLKNTKPAVKEIAATVLEPGGFMERHVRVDEEPFYAIELPLELQAALGRAPHLDVTLTKGTSSVYSRAFTAGDITALGKIYIPLRPYARLGETVILRLVSNGMRVRMLTGATEIAGDAPLFYDRVFTPLIFERDLPDGRIFRNVAEVPRFHDVTSVRRMTVDQLLATKNIDFAEEAIVTDPRPMNVEASDAVVTLRSYQDDEQIVDVSAPAKTLLVAHVGNRIAAADRAVDRRRAAASLRRRHQDDLIREQAAPQPRDPRQHALADAQEKVGHPTDDEADRNR